MIPINKEKCLGCGVCTEACFSGAITVENGCAAVNENCIYCGSCISACSADAISMEEVEVITDKNALDAYSGVWVIMECDSQSRMPKKVSYELLSEGRRLADKLSEEVSAVYLCECVSDQTIRDLQGVGCDNLFLLENKQLSLYNTEVFCDIITKLINQYKPSIVLFPGTENGRDLALRISARLKVGLTADCTALEINENRELVQVRPTYGGNIIASIVTPKHRPQMASVRANVFGVLHCDREKKINIIRQSITIGEESLKVKRIGTQPKHTIYKDVEEAEIVIVGGYGVGEEAFPLLRELAMKVGAAVGATRKAVDEGWAPFEIQIGQTGKIVSPDLYICFGVSGALQHTIGIRGAKKIIAVNNDPTAQIFGISDVAILGDCKTVLEDLLIQVDAKGKEVFSI